MAQYLQSRIKDPISLEPNEISSLRKRISEEEALVQTFESRMDELRAQISELMRQKDAKLVEIASLRNVLAPVRRVPLEILLDIFELVLEPRQWETNIVSHLFRLSSVCVAWRKAAHATPQLWSTLRISIKDQDYTWVSDWIARCQMVPVNLYLNLYGEESRVERVGKQLLEYILVHFAHKIRLLDIIGDASSLLPLLHLSPSSSLLSLEEISLTIYEDSEDDTIEDLVALCPQKYEVFLGAPKLHQVELNTALLLEVLALPSEQLTSLKVNDGETEFDPVMFIDVLLQCKQLVNLEIYLPSDDFIGFSTTLSIFLPTLRTLEVSCFNAADNILRCIITPLLERLSIRYCNQDLDSLVMDMARFQQRSSTTLSSLVFSLNSRVINRRHDQTEKVIAALSLFPTIRSLEICPPFDVNALMQAMTCTEGHHVLPNLQDLTLDGFLNYYHPTNEEEFRLSGSGFKSMVLSRWWPDGGGLVSFRNGLSRLQKVALWGFDVSDPAGDISHVSALSGLILDYTPVK